MYVLSEGDYVLIGGEPCSLFLITEEIPNEEVDVLKIYLTYVNGMRSYAVERVDLFGIYIDPLGEIDKNNDAKQLIMREWGFASIVYLNDYVYACHY